MTRDPDVERVAIALAWCERVPALLPPFHQLTREHELRWWEAQSDMARDGYRYRASVAIEAFEQKEFAHAAE